MEAGAIILAGGKSRRMGTNKALLKINDVPTIQRITHQLKTFFHHPILVTNDPDAYSFLGLTTVKDQFPGKGPLAGIHAGLMASPHEVNVVMACDMPFISAGLSVSLVRRIREYDAVVPIINGIQHPLYSVLKKKLVTSIEECIENDRLRMKDFLDHLNVLYVTEKDLQKEADNSLDRIFFNMNELKEYEDAKKWAEEEHLKRK